jgi:hypothetical protein
MTTQTELIPSASAEAQSGAAVRVQPLVRRAVSLSIRQPWAWLIVNGHKDVENRTWPTRFRGRVLIHAGATMTRDDYTACVLFIADMRTTWRLPAYDILKAQCGGVVGEAEIVDCVTESDSPWFVGDYGFVMRNQKVLPFHRCKGALGFFQGEHV